MILLPTPHGNACCISTIQMSVFFVVGASSGTRRRARRFQSKRARTIFSEHQLQVLHANFNIDSNPDARDLERIAQITGLSKRVTQVWFQNTRARQRRQNAVLHQAFPSLAYSMNYGANLGQVAMHPYVDAALLSGGMMPAMQPLSGKISFSI